MMDWRRAHFCAPRRILLKVCVCVCVCARHLSCAVPGCLPPPVFDFGYVCVRWCGSVFRWRHSARRFYRLVNSYLCSPHEHNCASVCKKGPFAVGKWNGYLIGEKIPVREQAYAFVCISQRGPGEQVVSHRDIWCAPRWWAGLQHRPFLCARMCGCMGGGVCVCVSLMTICAPLFKEALSAQPRRQMNY